MIVVTQLPFVATPGDLLHEAGTRCIPTSAGLHAFANYRTVISGCHAALVVVTTIMKTWSATAGRVAARPGHAIGYAAVRTVSATRRPGWPRSEEHS